MRLIHSICKLCEVEVLPQTRLAGAWLAIDPSVQEFCAWLDRLQSDEQKCLHSSPQLESGDSEQAKQTRRKRAYEFAKRDFLTQVIRQGTCNAGGN
jgi:hypothetical protein